MKETSVLEMLKSSLDRFLEVRATCIREIESTERRLKEIDNRILEYEQAINMLTRT